MSGIHHVTAISGRADRNLDFYTRVLGMRLVKKTVNFDDPGTYHLYYGDEAGRPGTILTFFSLGTCFGRTCRCQFRSANGVSHSGKGHRLLDASVYRQASRTRGA